MKCFFTIFFIALECMFLKGNCQVFFDSGMIGTVKDATLIVYGMNGQSQKIPYEKIKGSAFYNGQWRKASLYNQADKLIGVYDVKLNLVTHEVHFLDQKGMELAANDGIVSKVVFIDTVNGKPKNKVFVNNYVTVNNVYNNNKRYAEELNEGPCGLLKVTIRTGLEQDSMFQTLKKYSFQDRQDYYIRVNKRVEKLKKLNKDYLIPFLPQSNDMVTWAKKNNLKFNREEDVVRMIDYYNQTHKAAEKP